MNKGKMTEKEKKNLELNEEEIEILDAFEKGNIKRSQLSQERRNEIMQAAGNTLKKINRINIRIPSSDLQKIKRKAEDAGMPYQTLIGAILHQYAEDKIRAMI
jgi:predicted DNA binding CopG/RHH family protein